MNKFFIISCAILATSLTSTVQHKPQQWCYPEHKPIYTIFYQGLCNSQVQAAKYVGPDGFVATTGEHVVAECNAPLIAHLAIGPEIDEVILKNQSTDTTKRFFLNPKQIAATIKRGVCYGFSKASQWKFGIKISASDEHKPSVKTHDVNISDINLGQQQDIISHEKKVLSCYEQYPESDLILWGVSRGAATTFDAVACNNYSDKTRLVVLEGCFDSVDSVITSLWKPLQFWAHLLLKATAYDKNGIAPINMVEQFSMQLPEQTPVVFSTSLGDTMVPHTSVQRLAHALAQADKKYGKKRKIFLITLKGAPHYSYMKTKKDNQFYLQAIHTIYYYLNLPHLPAYVDYALLKKIKRSDQVCTIVQ